MCTVCAEILLPRIFQAAGQVLELDKLTPEDLEAVLTIERRSHATPWREAHFVSSLDHHLCLGAKLNGEWTAYAVVSFAAGEAELLLFVVDRPWQGRGLGQAMLDEVIALAALRAQTLFLEVRASNARAIALYEAAGFNQVGVRPNYYPSSQGRREDAWLYAIDLVGRQ